MRSKVVLVTGGSSGIGKATAEWFLHKGFHVYELSRHRSVVRGAIHLTGDVTSPQSCSWAVSDVMVREKWIDVLICNAGMGISGAAEFTSQEDVRQQMDVNFCGVANMVQAVLPYMRRQFSGRILIVSSMAAVFSIPFQSFYSASKAAVNAYALALRNEVSPFGIKVGVLMPGDVCTGFTSARLKNDRDRNVYACSEHAVAVMEHDERHGQSAQRIARRLYHLAVCDFLPVYNYEGWKYRLFAFCAKIFPATLCNFVVRRLYCGRF